MIFFSHESLYDFQLTFLSFSFLIYKSQGYMIWELRFLSGLKVQIPDYIIKSPSETWEIRKKKKSSSRNDLENQEMAYLFSLYWILNTGNTSVATFAV